ncbi:MAG: endolytic transglycosylase MltG, partial [Dehalococcoidia bacterium]
TAMVGSSADSLDGSILERPVATNGEPVEYTLADGASASQVGDELEELGVIRSGRQLELYAGLMGVQDRLRATTYELRTGMSVSSVLLLLTTSVTIETVRVTFPEGIRVEEMAVIAAEAGFGTAEEFISAAETLALPPAMEGLIPEGQGRQGFLFPDTYILPVGSTAADLVLLMFDTFSQRFDNDLRMAAEAHGLTPYQVLTIAAIVEREAVLPEERPVIASVFLNRISEGIKLDADPTVQFAVSQDPASVTANGYWKRELTIEDLALDNPYNTYVYGGFPPGPITNPGLASIEAVIFPAETVFYYFVANGVLGDGSHVFAETFEEHQANVAQYRQ